jgi:hypothetical protein
MNTLENNPPERVEQDAPAKRRELNNRVIEMSLWLTASLLLSGGLLIDIVFQREKPLDAFPRDTSIYSSQASSFSSLSFFA